MKMNGAGINGLVDGTLIQQVRCDTIANNLANLTTKGFKRDVLSFEEVLTMKRRSSTDFSQGPTYRTGNPLDVAVEGRGFFKVETKNGSRYTRNGAFTLDGENTLITQNGDRVMGENGPMTIGGNEVSIGVDGEVRVDGVVAGRFKLVDFENPGVLRKEGATYYTADREEEEVSVPANTSLHQGVLEESNVDVTTEMIRMVEAFRAFETMQKGIQSIDEMTGKLINDPGLF